jgi:hypothetical protein
MTKPTGSSITRRLIVWLTVGTAAFWLAAALFSSGILRQELNQSSDGALVETARRLLPLTIDIVEDRRDPHDVREVHHFREAREHGLAYQVRDKSDQLLLKSDDAPPYPFDVATLVRRRSRIGSADDTATRNRSARRRQSRRYRGGRIARRAAADRLGAQPAY